MKALLGTLETIEQIVLRFVNSISLLLMASKKLLVFFTR